MSAEPQRADPAADVFRRTLINACVAYCDAHGGEPAPPIMAHMARMTVEALWTAHRAIGGERDHFLSALRFTAALVTREPSETAANDP